MNSSNEYMTSIPGSEICKFYARPVDVKAKPADVIAIEYESPYDYKISRPREESIISEIELDGRSVVTVSTQTDYRESEAQTDPWDPPFVVKKVFNEPEILLLKEFSCGNGLPATHREVEYILKARQNRHLDVPPESIGDSEQLAKKKEHIQQQIKNEWDYRNSVLDKKQEEKLEKKRKSLICEQKMMSERRERLQKSLWTQMNEEMTKTNLKLQKDLKKEIQTLEKKYTGSTEILDPRTYGLNQTTKSMGDHIRRSKDSLNKDIDTMLAKYHANPEGLSKLTGWLERKRTCLYNEVPVAKPLQRTKREKLLEKAYQGLIDSKRTKMPPRVYRKEYEKEEIPFSPVKSEVEFEVLELPEEEGIDLVTVWQQVLRGRAYQSQMLNLIDKQKDALDVLLSSQT